MEQRLVECVPNFSEGQNKAIIDLIIQPILDNKSVTLLDIDMGGDFNRTVVTMVGDPESVLQTVTECTSIALELIDMRHHSGEHARMGAVDVVPFIPIKGVTMDECIELSNRYAKYVSDAHSLPVYLYAKSAQYPSRVRLPDVRKGEYEGLQKKLESPDWKPDFGPAKFQPTMGATATGARNFLIAYNVNLNTTDKSKANTIASKIRTSGTIVKDENGETVRDKNGIVQRIPGMFEKLQAAGWMYNEDTAQVSMNLLDYSVTGLHDVTETIKVEASRLGLEAVAGELVGLVPLQAIIDAGNFYSDTNIQDVDTLVRNAIDGLMLDRIESFDPYQNIIEWAIEREQNE
ncbi:MAG: glutamate formimidoyltransferase [Candidatus Thalassarchaeaceae archaeon]